MAKKLALKKPKMGKKVARMGSAMGLKGMPKMPKPKANKPKGIKVSKGMMY